jgi:dTDP-4-dehydrorhamnose 3,5-epimerase
MKIKHSTFEDERGSFTPIGCNLLDKKWDQFNISTNDKKYTFRGLHYQNNPRQTKCIKVIKGKILDIWVDLDTREVRTFRLDNTEFLFVPSNYAHGFLTLEDNTIVTYLVNGEYNSNSEHSIVWDTIDEVRSIINTYINGQKLTISEKDALGK